MCSVSLLTINCLDCLLNVYLLSYIDCHYQRADPRHSGLTVPITGLLKIVNV